MEPPKTALSSAKEQALLNAPAGKPPAGTKSNLDDPAKLDATIIPVLTLCLVICTMSIIVRSYTKKFLIKSLALEDCKSIARTLKVTALLTQSDIIIAAWVCSRRSDTPVARLRRSGWTRRIRCAVDPLFFSWRRKTHVGHQIEGPIRAVLRQYPENPHSARLRLTQTQVAQHIRNSLWNYCGSYQGCNSTTVSQDICAPPQKQHASLRSDTCGTLVYYPFLFRGYRLHDHYVCSSREDLESLTTRGSLFQFSRCVYGYRYIQRPIRLRDFGPPRGTNLEITIAVEEEDVDAGCFCDRLLVRYMSWFHPLAYLWVLHAFLFFVFPSRHADFGASKCMHHVHCTNILYVYFRSRRH